MRAMTWRTQALTDPYVRQHVDVNGTGHQVEPLPAGFGSLLRARRRANIERAKE